MSHQEKGGSDYNKNMKGVALGILLMGVSLAIIMLVYVWFGHMGPDFSATRQLEQEDALREEYRMPPREQFSPRELEIPPSRRNATGAQSS